MRSQSISNQSEMGQSCFRQKKVLHQTTLIQVGPPNPRLTLSSRPPQKEISAGFLQSPFSPVWSLVSPQQVSVGSRNHPASIAHLGHLTDNDLNETSRTHLDSNEPSLTRNSSRAVTPSTAQPRNLMLSPQAPTLDLNFSERRFYNLSVLLLKTQLEPSNEETQTKMQHLQSHIDRIRIHVEPDRALFLQGQAQLAQELSSKFTDS